MSRQIEETILLYVIAGLLSYSAGLTFLSIAILCRISFLAYQYIIVRDQEQKMNPLIQQMARNILQGQQQGLPPEDNKKNGKEEKEPMGFYTGTKK